MFNRVLLGALALVLAVCSADAAGYDSFSVGMAAFNRGENELAIQKFSDALAAGDLNAGLLPVTHLDRGTALLRLSKCADAAADAAAALAIKPDYRQAIGLRASASACAGDYKAAISDYQMLMSKSPSAAEYRELAFLYWVAGDFADAEPPLQNSISLEPRFAYGVLWLEVMRKRAGNLDPSAVTDDVSRLDLEKWPGPVFQLYIGKAKPEDIIAAASNGDASGLAGRQCEANFYVAEWWFAQNQPASAWPLLNNVKTNCPKDYFEYRLALAELKHAH